MDGFHLRNADIEGVALKSRKARGQTFAGLGPGCGVSNGFDGMQGGLALLPLPSEHEAHSHAEVPPFNRSRFLGALT